MRTAYLVLVMGVMVSTSYSGGLQPIQQMTVVDANGKKVGPVVDLYFDNYTINHAFAGVVTFKLDETYFALRVFRGGFAGFSDSTFILWESSDCSGDAFISPFNTERSLVPVGVVAFPRFTVYVRDGDLRPIFARSYSAITGPWPVGGQTPCWPINPAFQQSAAPARALTDLSTQFTPPFSLR